MAKRVLAAVGAIALVLVALVVRGIIDGDEDGGAEAGPPGDERVVLACDAELSEVCGALDGVEVVVQPSATTSAAVVDGGAGDIDGWVTTDVWLEVTDGRTESAVGQAERLANTGVALAVVPDRAGALRQLCADVSTWRCVGENAGRAWSELGGETTWGPLRVGMPSANSATGLSILTAAAVGWFEGTDFATNDFGADFSSWLARLTSASGSGDRDPLATMLQRAGAYSAAGTLAARIEGVSRPVETIAPAPPAAATVVLVDRPGGTGLGDVAADLRAALVDRGWRPAEGPPTSVLPPGVAGALHEAWRTAVG